MLSLLTAHYLEAVDAHNIEFGQFTVVSHNFLGLSKEGIQMMFHTVKTTKHKILNG